MAARAPVGGRPGARFAQFKLVLLGESAVGKSSLVLRFVKDQFDDYRESTIGAAFLTQTISLDENTTVKFEIWDTAGQERYKSLAPMYYRNANCAVVVYDITQSASLDKAKSWVKELQRQANENIIIALAGNKLDLVTENPDKRAIATADAEAYAKEAGLLFFETSAKTTTNVKELFTAIAKKLPLDQAGPRNLRTNARPGVDLRPEAAGTQGANGTRCQPAGTNRGPLGADRKMQQSSFGHFVILANHNISLHPPPPTQPISGRAARHAAILGIVKSDSAAVREQTAGSDAIARESHCKQPHHHRPGTGLSTLLSPTPVSPESQSVVPPQTINPVTTTPTAQGQTSPPSSIQPPQPPVETPSSSPIPPPTPKRKGRFRRFLLYLILTSGIAYGGGVFLALKSDNFHDFFTEYVPYGEESVLYFEERDFYRRFPNATRHSNRLPPIHKEESQRVTIPSKSGLSWKVSEEETDGASLTQKGPHNSAVDASKDDSASKTVAKAKEERAEKKAPVKKEKEAAAPPAPKEEPRTPAIATPTTLELIKVEGADEPVVQELVRIFNDIITVIGADEGAAAKYAAPVSRVRTELQSIGEKIISLRADAEKAAKEEVEKAHALFDESAKKLMQQIEQARAAEAAQFREEFESEREKLVRAYQDKIQTELSRAQELAEQRLKNELVEQAIELNRKYLNDVKELVERERDGRLSKISELTANVNQLEKLTTDWSDVIESNLKTQQLQVAVDAVRSVLESSTVAKPFVRELVAVKELAADDPVVAAAIASINPTAYQRGIPTSSQIIERFRRVAGEVRKASLLPEDAGIASHAASFVLSKVMFKRDAVTDGDDVESVLVRTENLLEEGNLDAAAREMNTLQGWAKILSKDWLADVRRVLEVKQALEEFCHYDHLVNQGPSATSSGTSTVRLTSQTGPDTEMVNENQNEISNFGYTSQSSHNTLALLRATEQHTSRRNLSNSSSNKTYETRGALQSDANRKYKELVRRLPSQACIDALVQTFFYGINWQYDLLDEEEFREQLDAWRKMSYSDLLAGPENLTPQGRVFPALLFQVLAQALLFHSPQDERVNILLDMAGMTFYDLGEEYSDVGAEILSLLGKRGVTIGSAQAGLLRASFLKSSGKVVEAWHILGATIRDAQEIGLHTGRPIPAQPSALSEQGARTTRRSYIGHKVWVVLHIWDIHMAVVLGRPIATNLKIDDFALTVDNDEKRRELFSHWQNATDPPRPFDVILAGYNVAYRYFPDIHCLEQNGARLQEYAVVEKVHAALKKNLELLPPWCRLEDPNTTFDQIPGCHWLPLAREGLSSLIYLVFLTLHRPYIFTNAVSRTEALRAGIAILRAQDRLFQRPELQSCKIFNPVYASFDALVLILAICITFLDQGLEQLAEAIQVVSNGLKRLDAIGKLNPMARSAHAVASNLYLRLQHRLNNSRATSSSEIPLNNTDLASHCGCSTFFTQMPSELDFHNVSPPHPLRDLFYDHLSTVQIPPVGIPDNVSFDPLTVDLGDGWDFEGTFADESFWSFINGFDH
ncbi:hypothetical protein TCE0_039r12900 [Talaromyces pinophilus]|uniref:MICOS complex subunit MIC60 n=1 Tax=Talaromyces pinophilus TaxID=128442 RepID=A0A6N4SLA4_TALPI|nr:hypothetical protein TCE0_039r12900 [Talaromyces pinophilus]